MAFITADWIQETSSTTGTGNLSLAGARTPGATFSSVCANGDTFEYSIGHESLNEYETGLGTYNTSGNTISRTAVFRSSNNNTLVNFSIGIKLIDITQTSKRILSTGNQGIDNSDGATITLGDGDFFNLITSTTAITAFVFTNDRPGRYANIHFATSRVLTHNATSLILPTGGTSVLTAVGDRIGIVSLGGGNFRVLWYQRGSGAPVINPNASTSVAGVTVYSSTTAVQGGIATASAATPDAIAAIWEQGTDNTDGATITLGEGGFFNLITSTTAITAFALSVDKAGRAVRVRFQTVRTLTHNATTLILPTAANITTAVGDTATLISLGSGNFLCTQYLRANGTPLSLAFPGAQSLSTGTDLTVTVGDDLFCTAQADVVINGGDTAGGVAIHAGLTPKTGANDNRVTISADDQVVLEPTNVCRIFTSGVERLEIEAGGAWQLAGNVGTAGQVLTSAGAGVPPSWGTLPFSSTTQVLTGTDTATTVTPDSLAALWEAGADNTGGATITLGEGGSFNLITSTTAITAFAFTTDKAGRQATIRFNTVRTLTHNATSLILPGAANITTAVGDICRIESLGSGNFRVNYYSKASASPLLGGLIRAPQLVTSTNASFAHPAGTRILIVEGIGGGGAGGGAAAAAGSAGSGGNSGTWGRTSFLNPSLTSNITVGAGGTAGTAGSAGNNGGSSSLVNGATTVTLPGGTGGTVLAGGSTIAAATANAANSAATNADISVPGEIGMKAYRCAALNTASISGDGGSNPLGTAGLGSMFVAGTSTAGTSGTGFGSGAGGRNNGTTTTATAGTAGQPGAWIIYEYS